MVKYKSRKGHQGEAERVCEEDIRSGLQEMNGFGNQYDWCRGFLRGYRA